MMSNELNANMLIEILKTTNDPNERNETAIRLGDLRCNEAVPFILELLEDPRCANNKGTLIYSLQNLALSEEQLIELIPLLNGGNFEVRCEVYELLKCYTDILKNNDNFRCAVEKMIDEEEHKLFVLEELYDDITLQNENSEISHPYNQFENSNIWNIVKESINDLVDNQDSGIIKYRNTNSTSGGIMDYQAKLMDHLQAIVGKQLDALNVDCEMMMFSFGTYELHTQCLTRIICDNDILVATLDYQSWNGEAEENNDEWYFVERNRDKIVGGTVTSVNVNALHDVVIVLDTGIRIELFIKNGYHHFDNEHEQWVFFKHHDHSYPFITVYSKTVDIAIEW